jgi:tRNA pseudouridine55 synthase
LEVKYELNKLIFDEFGRPNGVMLFDKPPGITAHDLVDLVRKKLNYSKVGHAGALDSFSSGLMIILVGKATKMSDKLMVMEKSYRATMILGIATETQDIEGKILDVVEKLELTDKEIENTINSFLGGYEQHVSIYSSVKVNGKKLRKVLRDKRYTYKLEHNKTDKKIILFNQSGEKIEETTVPQKFIDIQKISIESISKANKETLPYFDKERLRQIKGELIQVVFSLHCSKGTYIRQLSEDIGAKLGIPASLIALRRTSIGSLNESDVMESKFLDS